MRQICSFILIVMILFPLGCKSKSKSSLSDVSTTTFQDSFFLNTSFLSEDSKCQQNIFNIYAESIANGFLLNAAYSNLQTNSPVGPNLKSDSLYFQGLRIFSIFDWDLTETLKSRNSTDCFPGQTQLTWSPVPKNQSSFFTHAFPQELERFKKLSNLIGVPEDSISIYRDDGNSRSHISRTYGIQLKQEELNHDLKNHNNETRKLRALIQSYNPLYASIFLQLKNEDRNGFEILLPPLGELDFKNSQDVKLWEFKPGITRRNLPRQVNVNVAKLQEIAYLEGGYPNPVIRIQMEKSFSDSDRVKTKTSFGVLKGINEKGKTDLDIRDSRGALIIGFIPYLNVSGDDSSLVRGIKEELNQAVSSLRVDARIHQLSLDLVRDPNKNTRDHGPDAVTFRPKFKLRESELSFRIYHKVNLTSDKAMLKNVGFICPEGAGECYQDFGAFSDLNSYLTSENDGPRSGKWRTKVGEALKSALNKMVKYNTKFLINWNITVIEEALDQQFEQIFSDLLDQQIETREKVKNRIEQVIFAD